jgi:CO/xanthine dehydrogenase FAD-binding subunit
MEPLTGWAIEKVARRSLDFALVGVTAVVTLDDKGQCKQAKVVLFSVSDRPIEAIKAGEILKGQALDDKVIKEAAHVASTEEIDPSSDIHATAKYRRHLAEVLTRRALEQAFARVNSNGKRRKS